MAPWEDQTDDIISVRDPMRFQFIYHPDQNSTTYWKPFAPSTGYSDDIGTEIFLCIGLICRIRPIVNSCNSRKGVSLQKQGFIYYIHGLTTGRSY